jgi:hypothetical protein
MIGLDKKNMNRLSKVKINGKGGGGYSNFESSPRLSQQAYEDKTHTSTKARKMETELSSISLKKGLKRNNIMLHSMDVG